MSQSLRKQLIEFAIAMNASGINQGTSGNLSIRTREGMLITPSGKNYSSLNLDDIVAVDHSGIAEGSCLPSSEWRIHRDIYQQRTDAQAIVHAHPSFCVTLACLKKSIPAFHYMVAVAGGRDIRCSAYATFGTQELSDHVMTALVGRKACLMANHGMICLERDLPCALALAIEIEQLAKAYYQGLVIGDPLLLDDEEMERVLERFANYGAGP